MAVKSSLQQQLDLIRNAQRAGNTQLAEQLQREYDSYSQQAEQKQPAKPKRERSSAPQRGGPLVATAPVKTKERVSRPEEKQTTERDELRERERRIPAHIERLKRLMDKQEPESPAADKLQQDIEREVRELSQVQAKLREHGESPRAEAERRARRVRNQVHREEQHRERQSEQRQRQRESTEEYRRRQEARAEATAQSQRARARAKETEYQARERAYEDQSTTRRAEQEARAAERTYQRQLDHEMRMEQERLRQRGVRGRERRKEMRQFRQRITRGTAGAARTARVASKRQKAAQAQAYARRRPTTMASRVPARAPVQDYVPSIHDTRAERVIAAGGVEALTFGTSSFASAAFNASRNNDVWWSIGGAAVGFLVAGGAREDATIRDISLGWGAGAAAVLTLRMLGKLKRFNGQQ